MYRSFIVGFVLEYCLGVSKIYDNVNRKTTIRRLSKIYVSVDAKRR